MSEDFFDLNLKVPVYPDEYTKFGCSNMFDVIIRGLNFEIAKRLENGETYIVIKYADQLTRVIEEYKKFLDTPR